MEKNVIQCMNSDKEKRELSLQEVTELRRKYENEIEEKKGGFELIARIIGYTIYKMKMEGLLEQDVEVWGRLKSFKSAYENYQKKAIDDCFGIRIIAQNDGDLEKVRKQIEKLFVVDQTKDHRKKSASKYNAIHEMVHLDSSFISAHNMKEELTPAVEIQYWNNELEEMCETGEISYSKYKHKDMKRIQEMYDENPFDTYKNLPTYYEIRGNKIRMLSAEETLIKLYPDLIRHEAHKKGAESKQKRKEIMCR